MVLTRTVVPDYHHLQCSYIHGARRQGAVLSNTFQNVCVCASQLILLFTKLVKTINTEPHVK